MGRLLAALIAENETGAAATLATPATRRPESSGVARVASLPVPESRPAAPRTAESQAARLLAAIRAEGLPDALIGHASGDPAELAALPDHGLRAYVVALHESMQRELGNRPLHETAAALCRHCGPVWLAPNIAAVAPVVSGWPLVLGCPWCHVKDRMRMPRPTVTCGECRHFQRDAVNPRDGAGECRAGIDPPKPWPRVTRVCARFEP